MITYTFHVSLPGYGRVWRKIELAEEATLADLHASIQDAYQFYDDHLYSFFMSGKAWDSKTEYTLPNDMDPWNTLEIVEKNEEGQGEDEQRKEEPSEAEIELAQSLFTLPDPSTIADNEEVEAPSPTQMRAMLTELKGSPEMREQFLQAMSAQLGMPPAMAQAMIRNLEMLFESMSDQDLETILSMDENALGAGAMGDLFGAEESEAGDVQSTTLAALNFKQGKRFLYLFDYGDEWRFNVRVHAINKDADPELAYPILVESVGNAPSQYEEEDEEEDE